MRGDGGAPAPLGDGSAEGVAVWKGLSFGAESPWSGVGSADLLTISSQTSLHTQIQSYRPLADRRRYARAETIAGHAGLPTLRLRPSDSAELPAALARGAAPRADRTPPSTRDQVRPVRRASLRQHQGSSGAL